MERYYDLSSEKIAEEWYPNEILTPTHRDFLSLLPNRPIVLDLGCGPGYESGRLHALGATVIGIDLSSKSIEIAKARNPECVFYKMDFYEINPSIGHFHGILASGSLIHAPPERLPMVLVRIGMLLYKDGILAALIRDGNGEITRHHEVNGSQLEWIAYMYTKEKFTAACQDAGIYFEREGFLDEKLCSMGWRCYFYRKR